MSEVLFLDETTVPQTWLCIIIVEPLKNTRLQKRYAMIIEDIDSLPVAMTFACCKKMLLKIKACKTGNCGKSTVVVRQNIGEIAELVGIDRIFYRSFRSIPQKDWDAENQRLSQSLRMA